MSTDDDLDLEESETEEGFSFPPSERKLVTQSYDLSVQTLVEQWQNKTLILPDIQREYLWDNGRSSRLIESLLLNIPIPVLYFAETEDSTYEIIDGHQRVKSVARYINNEFRMTSLHILNEHVGKSYFQLPPQEQRMLKMRIIRAVIISHDSHPNMKFEIFERLNSGSISLSSQELRNSMFRGPFTQLIRSLVKDETFRALIGSKSPRKRMVDEELILRFFSMRASYNTYKPPLKRFLNICNDALNKLTDAEREERANTFRETVRRVYSVLDSAAFRITDEKGAALEKAVNKALFDAQMLAFSWAGSFDGQRKKSAVLKALSQLYKDEGFLDSIRRATGDRSRTRTRVRGVAQALQQAGVDVTPPYDIDDQV